MDDALKIVLFSLVVIAGPFMIAAFFHVLVQDTKWYKRRRRCKERCKEEKRKERAAKLFYEMRDRLDNYYVGRERVAVLDRQIDRVHDTLLVRVQQLEQEVFEKNKKKKGKR